MCGRWRAQADSQWLLPAVRERSKLLPPELASILGWHPAVCCAELSFVSVHFLNTHGKDWKEAAEPRPLACTIKEDEPELADR